MGDKYKIKKSALKALFSMAEMAMEGRYHEIYSKFGVAQGKNKNFICINALAHGRGEDANPSMSIDNKTGQWHCFTCGIKGNFQSYWKEYLSANNPSYTDFLIDTLDLNTSQLLTLDTSSDPDFERNTREIKALYDKLQKVKTKELGRPWLLHGELSKMVKELSTISMKWLDEAVESLLACQEDMEYLYKTRKIDEKIIKKFRIGRMLYKGHPKFVFPVINAEGSLVNAKAYDPRGNPDFKWVHPFPEHDFLPVPINNFTKQRIIFFEGEPDLYCAIAFGYEGAVTLGTKGKHDVNEVFGEDHARQIFQGKEIVICLDSDAQKEARELALSVYPYAAQVKIIDLDRSEINRHGLDPTITHETSKTNNAGEVVKKIKRSEKDFTDFMRKNGFNESAKDAFDTLIENTPVFVNDKERLAKKVFKVTLQEARMSRYYSSNRSKELELTASVSDFNCNAYLYPVQFTVVCRAMCNDKNATKTCLSCMIKDQKDFGKVESMTFNLIRERTKENANDSKSIEISDHNILGLIELTDSQKVTNLKKACGINDRCGSCAIIDGKQEKLLHVRLVKDVNGYNDASGDTGGGATTSIDMEAYIEGDADIYPNKSYRFKATQTTAWNGQHAVLYISKSEPIDTSIELFKMDQQIHDILSIFKQKDGETIQQHLDRRYTIFANAAGVTGRRELFFINDLVYFSPIEIKNKMLPEIKRGWVEALIAGDPRTCKTLISRFLNKHYKIGEIVAGSSGVSYSGLMAGISFFKNKSQVSWGRMPMNDRGVVIIDEMSEIEANTLIGMNELRSEGILKIDKIKSDSAFARVRKVMLSNARPWRDEEKKEYTYGVQFLRDLCLKDSVFSRFDIGFVVKRGDVDISEFESNYSEISTEFNEFQCRMLIMWAYSRKAEDILFEEGFNELANTLNVKLNEKFHSSTQLINQERARLVRLSASLATMLYSTPDNDPEKILVKKEHLEFIVSFLDTIYCHPNMKMDQYSKMRASTESMGDMKFMENVCKYIDINPLFREDEFTERGIHQIFYDYLQRVANSKLFMPDAKSDKTMNMTNNTYESNQKLIGILTSRNCLTRTRKGTLKKTAMFNSWLEERISLGDKATFSDILELESNKSDSEVIDKARKIIDSRKFPKKFGAA